MRFNWNFFKSKIGTSTNIIIGVVIVGIAFIIGMYVGGNNANGFVSSLPPSFVNNASVGQPASVDFAPFWQAWHILQDTYVPAGGLASTTNQDRVWGAIKGLADSYGDPYTTFFPPKEEKSFQTEITGNFGGIGMELGEKNGTIIVIAPLKGSPAAAAGIVAGDAILKINASSTASMTIDQAVNLIRGPVGTTVHLTVIGPTDREPKTIAITRQTISIPEINTQKLPNGIFDIQLYTFTTDSATLFRNALIKFAQSGDQKLILDLRGNPGGYLDAAVDMASFFLPSNDIVVREDGGNGNNHIYYSKGYDVFNPQKDPNFKMAILVDGGSASAAEILSSALQENGVAKLVGTQTFGKGSVQELIPLTSATALKITVARWLTPNNSWISGVGITPNYIVPLTAQNTAGGVDPQLQAAENILLGKAATSTTP